MATTYLSLINKVLARLRETEVLTPTDTDYAVLVGALVNDAKRTVENAWDWSMLRTTKTVSATIGTQSYAITGAGYNFKLLDAYNDTQNGRMWLTSQMEMNTLVDLQGSVSGAPDRFAYSTIDSNGDQNIKVWPVPDDSYTLKFPMVVREAELSSATDSTTLPAHLIVSYAWAMAARERGETGGTSAQELFAIADRALADAIALDATRFPHELTWRAV